MSIIPNKPIYGNQNLHNIANNLHPPLGISPHRNASFYEKIPEIGKDSGQAGGRLRSFNKKLAFDLQRKLKSKKPDITGAFVLGTLQTWKNARRHARMGNRVLGAVYQSVEGICEDLPWLDRSSVHRAIQRLEQAFPKDFIVDRSSTRVLNFEISDKLTRLYFAKDRASKNEGSVELALHISDAKKYGVLKALLIRNLEYKTREDKVSSPLKDCQGRIYGEMSSSRLTQETSSLDGSPSAPILPFGRQSVNKAIRSLVRAGFFVEHLERRGFYRVEREEQAAEPPGKTSENRLSSNATVVSSNATVLSSNATKLSPDATVYSGQIVRDGNGDRNEMESDKEATDPSPAAQSVDFSNSELFDLNESEGLHPDQELIKNCALFTESSNRPLSKLGAGSTDSLTTINLPRFFEDEFPDLMRDVNENVQRSRNARKTPPEPIHPDLLPFDFIADPERLSWLENGLILNPLTDRPIDWSNFEEQIDIAMDELAITSFFRVAHSKRDILEFREHFKRYEGLSIPMVAKMLDRVAGATQLPKFKPSRKERVDHDYFARIIKDLKTFNRYFEELFRETFAPFIDGQGEARFEKGSRMRWWPGGEKIWNGDFEYPLSESPENMPEPFRSILEKEITAEREKLLKIEESFPTLGDAQDDREVEIPQADYDRFIYNKIDAVRGA